MKYFMLFVSLALLVGCGAGGSDTANQQEKDMSKTPKKVNAQKIKSNIDISSLDLKPENRIRKPTLLVVDKVNGQPFDKNKTYSIPNALRIEGWAIDKPNETVGGGVIAMINGKPFPGMYGKEKPKLSESLKMSNINKAGFEIVIPKNRLPKGELDVNFLVLTKDKKQFYRPATTVKASNK